MMDPRPLEFFAAATGGRLAGGAPGIELRRVTTDSRDARAGDLFVAVSGERFDGHDFLRDVVGHGVAAVLVSERRGGDVPPGTPAVVVPDTRRALLALAAAYRRQFSLPVACVAGSNGKTTTKEMLAALVSPQLRTLRSEASFNNEIGVPLTLLRLDVTHQAAVLEAGTNHPGELAPLVAAIAPRIGLVPSVGREHLEHFGSLEGVVEEESALGRVLPSDGVLVLGADQPAALELAARTSARVVTAGFQAGASWRVRLVAAHWDTTEFALETDRAGWSGRYTLGMPGRHMVSNAAVAMAAAAELGIGPDSARSVLAAFRGARQRLQWSDLGGVRVLDDTYNANADSMLAALQTLADLPCSGRRVAILGDMAELGLSAEAAHAEIGSAAGRLGIDVVCAIGRFASVTAGAARGAGETMAFADVTSAAEILMPRIQAGDCVLVKASRSSRLERVVESLRNRFSPAG
jgi:UDP-N-acetylmuramoyl-tripeptide--D-alanyl-D-alanine ligase